MQMSGELAIAQYFDAERGGMKKMTPFFSWAHGGMTIETACRSIFFWNMQNLGIGQKIMCILPIFLQDFMACIYL